jgi:hypothetical protein
MKTIYIFLFSLLFSFTINAQSFIDKNYSSYFDKEDVTRVTVGAKAFSMMHTLSKHNTEAEAQQLANIVSKIKGFDLLVIEKVTDSQASFNKGLSQLKGFEELIKVKNKEANVSIQIKESNSLIEEIVGLVAAEDNFIVFNLIGSIDLDEVAPLISKLDDKKLSQLMKGSKINVGDLKVSPNPVKQGQKVNVTVPAEMQGGKATLYDIDGKKIAEYNIENSSIEIDTDKMKTSAHVIKLQKDGNMYSRKIVVTE